MSKKKSKNKELHMKKNIQNINKKREEWAVKLVRIFGTPLAKAIALLPVKMHPNVITILSFPFAILAGFYLCLYDLCFGYITNERSICAFIALIV